MLLNPVGRAVVRPWEAGRAGDAHSSRPNMQGGLVDSVQ